MNKRVTLTKDITNALLTEGRIFLKDRYSEKFSKTYNVNIIFDNKDEDYPGFLMEFESKVDKNNG